MRGAKYISGAGCNATAAILALHPIFKAFKEEVRDLVLDVKAGSSQGGNGLKNSSLYSDKKGCVRVYSPFGHRHSAEISQELEIEESFSFTASSLDMVRGVQCVSHLLLKRNLPFKEIWQAYRREYKDSPFIRMIREKEGNFRLPEPKLLSGTNFCDISFEIDNENKRLVIVSAIDNLMKGAAGQAVQGMNLMYGFKEDLALEFCGLYPV